MARRTVVAMPGDGIGELVLPEAIRVLDAVGFEADYVHGDIGWKFWMEEGNALPERTVELLAQHRLGLFGAITSKPKEQAAAELKPALRSEGFVYFSPIVGLRQRFNLDICIRPCASFPGNPLNFIRRTADGGFEEPKVDAVVFRQNTEGLYAGLEWTDPPRQVVDALATHPKFSAFAGVPAADLAISTRVFTRNACRRIVRAAFEYAKKHDYASVTICEKPNVLRETSGMMEAVAREVHADYPEIEHWSTNIDAQMMWLTKNPENYGVMVAGNMFGDIVSDAFAGLVGGLGFAASGNIGDEVAVFEPTHGSAPKYAELDPPIVNPIAMFLSAAMMLDHVGELDRARSVRDAVAAVVAEGRVRTYDMLKLTGGAGVIDRGAATTRQVTDAVIDKLTGVEEPVVTAGSGSAGATAGRRGADIRSDLWVSIERADSGGIRLACRSRVEPYYGDAIRRQVPEVLAGLGVDHARVEIEDSGAAPFVIAARLEAAALSAGLISRGRLTAPRTRRGDGTSDRLRRSRLYLPGNEPKYLINAGLYGADAVIFDLEDSVHPDAKTDARRLVCRALRTLDFRRSERMVRINQLPLGLEDLEHVVPEGPDLLLLPKIERPDQVREVADAVDRIAGEPLWLMPILESALGVENAFAIAGASRSVVALTIGLEDYAADIGVPRSPDGEESVWARRRLVNAARAAAIQPIDSVYGQVDDLDGLLAWGKRSRRQGFVGMGCLHPRQIPVIHEAFAPTDEEIARSERIVRAAHEAQREGRAVVSLGSKMIDPPVVRQARALVEHARRIGLTTPGSGEADGQD